MTRHEFCTGLLVRCLICQFRASMLTVQCQVRNEIDSPSDYGLESSLEMHRPQHPERTSSTESSAPKSGSSEGHTRVNGECERRADRTL